MFSSQEPREVLISKTIAETITHGGVRYRCEYRKCGKGACEKCQAGQGHGPYWYAYDAGKRRYLGRKLPAAVEAARQAARARRWARSPLDHELIGPVVSQLETLGELLQTLDDRQLDSELDSEDLVELGALVDDLGGVLADAGRAWTALRRRLQRTLERLRVVVDASESG